MPLAHRSQQGTGAVARTFRKWRKRCSRACRILTSPSKLSKILFEFLDRWVTRRTVVTFTMLEALASAGAILFFCVVRDISDLGFFIKSLFFYPFVMFIRLISSGLGCFASLNRKVKLTKFYFALLSFNIPMTFVVCVPLWRCTCTCDRHEFMPLQRDSRVKDADCKVLQQFASIPLTPEARILSSASDIEPTVRSHALAVAHAVADTVGTPYTNFSILRYWRDAAARTLCHIRYLFSVVSVPPRLPSSRRLSGQRRRLWRRPLTDSSQSHRAGAAHASAREEHTRGRGLSTNSGLKFQYPILHYFDVTEDGIGWRSELFDCETVSRDLSTEQVRSELKSIRTYKGRDGGREFATTCTKPWCRHLIEQLEACVKDEECGAVQGRVNQDGDAPGEPDREARATFGTCQYSLPVFPTLLSPENKSLSVFFQKSETVTMKSMLLNQFEEDAAGDKCYAVVTLVMMSLLLLDIVSAPMFIIVQKFLMRRCGDFLSRERQFSVQFSSEEEDSEDDFTIGSGTWMGGSPESRPSRCQSSSSSFHSMREDGSFSPSKAPGSGARAPRKGTMPEHWKGTGTQPPPATSSVELADSSSKKPDSSGDKHVRIAEEERTSVVLQMDSTITMATEEQGSTPSPQKSKSKGQSSMYSWG